MKPVRATPVGSHAHAQPHRHSAGLLQEHDEEPVPGLPEELPQGEHILWQGAPTWRVLAQEAFHIKKVAVYFGLIGVLRFAFLLEDELTVTELIKAMSPFLVLAAGGLFILWSLAWLSARHTLYTITNRRVVMRIGIVLTVTFNIPFSRMTGANMRLRADGAGDVTLEIEAPSRIPYLQLWPHARAWHLRQPQPTLRGVLNAQQVADLLRDAWSQSRHLRAQPAETVERSHASHGVPVAAHQS